MCARSGANCGSLFLDLRFRELVRTLLVDHPAHLDAASLAYFMHSFSETEKLTYRGEIDDGTQEPNQCPPAAADLTPPFFVQVLCSTLRASTWKTRMTLKLACSTESSLFQGTFYVEKCSTLS
jgi:hypothetical protein